MSGDLARAYMAEYKRQMGFLEVNNEVPNERMSPPTNNRVPEPQHVNVPIQPPAGRISHNGCCSDVLPALHSHDFSKSAIHFNGSTLHHSEKRGSGVHFGHGSVVDTRHLNGFGSAPHTGGVMGGTKFGLNDGRLEFSRPRVEKKRR